MPSEVAAAAAAARVVAETAKEVVDQASLGFFMGYGDCMLLLFVFGTWIFRIFRVPRIMMILVCGCVVSFKFPVSVRVAHIGMTYTVLAQELQDS